MASILSFMLYAVMMRLDSLREIKASLFANVNRFNHLGLKHFPVEVPCQMQINVEIPRYSVRSI